jgi:hypothetical protein
MQNNARIVQLPQTYASTKIVIQAKYVEFHMVIPLTSIFKKILSICEYLS